eukprot:879351-Alexandrium_andersonii.AAC.1
MPPGPWTAREGLGKAVTADSWAGGGLRQCPRPADAGPPELPDTASGAIKQHAQTLVREPVRAQVHRGAQ